MHRNKIVIYILSLAFLSSCIKPFTPNIDSDAASKIVVSGKLTNKEGFQTVTISKSLPLDDLNYQALTNCSVSIWDEYGNEYKAFEFPSSVGDYTYYISPENIKVGTAYYIRIITPDGDELVSDPDIMPQVAPISIPYYKKDSSYNEVYNSYTTGLKFNVDIEGILTDSRYYLFEMDATYEHHAVYDREWYYDGSVHHIFPPDSSLFYCWTTERVPEIFTLSTKQLAENKFKNFDLHFVSFYKDYLTHGYSLLFRQIGLSREAYLYWESVRLNNNQNASLYSKQPVDTQGNIKYLTNPENEVLGFFAATAIRETRIFIEPQPTQPYPICTPMPLERAGFREIARNDYPAFLMNNPRGTYSMIMLPDPCVNCASLHGSNIKPDFWPY
ncbi:MAG: DUF4249 domain-containing protein [Bacteroidales bacterium]|jgi:hypothetical protein|nr:DUF4249 domain-containing protein [Bacteroidales bacterium]